MKYAFNNTGNTHALRNMYQVLIYIKKVQFIVQVTFSLYREKPL